MQNEPVYSLYSDGFELFVGGEDKIFISPDGDNFSEISLAGFGVSGVSTIAMFNNKLFIGTLNKGVLVSADFGRNWNLLSSGLIGLGANLISGFAVRNSVLYVTTEGSGVFTLTGNNGNSWVPFNDSLPWSTSQSVNSIYNYNGKLIIGAGGNGLVYINEAGANYWVPKSYELFNGSAILMYSITSLSDGKLMGTGSFGIYSSSNGGETWSKFDPGVGLISEAAFARNGNDYYALVSKPGRAFIYKYSNLFLQWELFETVYNESVYDILVFNDKLYLATESGIKSIPLTPNSIDDKNNPGDFSLGQAFPNPFISSSSSDIKIPVTLEKPGVVEIEVFNIIGERIMDKMFFEFSTGDNLIKINTNLLGQNVYIYRATFNGRVKSGKFTVVRE
ncbi:MAG: T9SS type A sorting domain-containing protein [Ignavibacteriaceae bacterium]|nr:T9SS type A sorting domain-containing protein [Ignavibacteriaceae bacterium]